MNKQSFRICCTVCEREMDYTKDESAWVTTPVADGDAYACSSLCALRLGHTLAKEEYKAIIAEETSGILGDAPSIPPPAGARQPAVN